MIDKETFEKIAWVKRRIKNAKRRAMYWSGIPTFNERARALDPRRQHEEKYELALCDVHGLSCLLATLEYRELPERRAYDPRRDFGGRFVKLMGEINLKKS